MTRFRNTAIVLCAIFATVTVPIRSTSAEEPKIPWSRTVKSTKKPKIWKNAAGQSLLAAEEVAKVDAYRKLLARIYGVKIDATTNVLDLVMENQKIGAALEGMLRGVKEVGWRFYDDGRCEVAVRVTIRQVVEVITRTHKKYKTADKKTIERTSTQIETLNRDTKLIEVGNGALKGSLGLKRIRARRAAEMDVYRRLAQRVIGLKISSKTTVGMMVLESDAIKTNVTAFLKGIRSTDVRYGDKICEVDGELTIRQIVECIRRVQRRYLSGGKWKTLEYNSKDIEKRDKIIKVTGKASITDRPAPKSKWGGTEEEIIETIIKKEERVIRKEVGVVE